YSCRKQFTVTTNTCMHRSHFTLSQWLVALYMASAGKKGVAALELQRVLGIGSYKCAWHLVHRIREAMGNEPRQRFRGVVEADETWVGGKQRLEPSRGSGRVGLQMLGEKKVPVMAIMQRGGNVRTFTIPNVRAST